MVKTILNLVNLDLKWGEDMFVGRKAELDFLESKYVESESQLVLLYGRRRIGKTETLKEFCKDKKHIFYSCTQTSAIGQLSKFSKQILIENHPAKRYTNEFPDWKGAFSALKELPFEKERKLLVIDEFPILCKGNESFLWDLKEVWEKELKNENIIIILCGSATSYIEKEILTENNPFYSDLTGVYKMESMGFFDACSFFPYYTSEEKVLAYSVLGGIPRYLKQFEPTAPLFENIKKKILTKGSVLYSEADFALHKELREVAVYNSIMETIADGSSRLGDITKGAYINDTAKTSVYIKNLSELGIVERVLPVDAKSKFSVSGGVYRLTDNFFKFWYSFGLANFSQLEDGDVEGVFKYNVEPFINEYASFAFVDVCIEYIKKLQKEEKLPFRYSSIGYWCGKTFAKDGAKKKGDVKECNVDILCVNQDKTEYLVGDCNFSKERFSYSRYEELKDLLPPFDEDEKVYFAFFSRSGFDDKLRLEARRNDYLLLFDIDEIVSSKKTPQSFTRKSSMESFLL